MAVALTPLEVDRVPAALAGRAARVVDALRASAPSAGTRVGGMAAYHMGWADVAGAPRDAGPPGKMLRGALCVWACEAFGGDPDGALPAAAALEWVHNFTLVHDDIQDGDAERRHQPAVWTVWGASQAINAGDGLCVHAHRLLTAPGRHPARRLRALRVIDSATLDVIEGQCLDLDLEGRVATAPGTYLRMARLKTGALFGAALASGALLAGAAARDARLLAGAGRDLGTAFQVRDDWLGAFGDPALTGKPHRADLVRRKLTHVVVSAYARAGAAGRQELRTLFARTDSWATTRLGRIVDESGASEGCAALATELAERAVDRIGTLGLDADRHREIAELGRYAAERVR